MDASVAAHLGAILLCFVGSCFFSGAETALTSLSQVQAERLANGKSWWGRSIRVWIRMPNRLLATNLLGNTLVNVGAATVATSLVAKHYPSISLVVVTSVLTVGILVFGEIAPKMIARTYPEAIAPIVCRVLIALNYVFSPITQVITKGIVLVLKIFGVILPTRRFVSSSDIEAMVLMANREGSMEMDKSKILSSVFEFSKRRVKDIMIPKDSMSALSVDAGLLEALEFVRQENHSRYPVYKGNLDRIIGFLHARDLFGVMKSYGFSDGPKPPIENFSLHTCLRRAFFVSEQAMISHVLNEMKRKRIHLAIVKDEWGNVVGLVTLEDILEEVFGEIEDEHDEGQDRPLVDLFEVGVEVEGDLSLVDLKSRFDIEIDSSDSYATVNGFLQHYASHQQLTSKTVIIWKNYVFSILSVREGEIERVRITQIPDDDKDS
ncbi:MAG: HlyC/CorC family transporter [Bradymonadales bacterium]|nr:MAG: HlyC/CorC family transporter [Bradymonadales bacterium]